MVKEFHACKMVVRKIAECQIKERKENPNDRNDLLNRFLDTDIDDTTLVRELEGFIEG